MFMKTFGLLFYPGASYFILMHQAMDTFFIIQLSLKQKRLPVLTALINVMLSVYQLGVSTD